jgi:serine/threonine protein kinase
MGVVMNVTALDEEAIFKAARKLPAGDARAAYLDEACSADHLLRDRVEALLRVEEQDKSFLAAPAVNVDPTIDHPSGDGPGTLIGPYKIVELIGEGGMGAVYLAKQTEPVKRLVALKVIKAGMDSRQVLARFEAERQALALMDHPNIAKVLDAGAMDSASVEPSGRRVLPGDPRLPNASTLAGRPYFVMELVKGVPITKFCDGRKLTPRERLELFLPVCHAIQHAHQKGIIHRDIKPTNVLVALYDGRPVPKVIDFGVAKAAGQPLTEKTLITGLGAIVGTPEYMSPEQAELNQLDIDTRSDIYSLGVLLYELLTGTTPLTRKRLKDAALLEVLRVIREEEPQKPSTRLSTTDELPSIAANRGTEPARLSRLVRGELDWIVMKALEKDRNRRYETANGFAMDVQRYLADEPVLACPPTLGYRLRKFVSRNKGRMAVAVALSLLLLGAGALAWHADRQATQRRFEAAERDRDDRARRDRNGEALAALLDQCKDALRAEHADRAAVILETAERRAADGGAEELSGRLDRCRADLKLLRELDAINTHEWTWTYAAFQGKAPGIGVYKARWRAALTDFGVVLGETPVSDAVDRVNNSLVRERILAALDLWLGAEPTDSERLAGDPGGAWVRAVLRAADPDPYREAVRSAELAGEPRAMATLLEQSEALSQPPRFATVIARFSVVPAERRRAMMESALRTRPGDLSLLMALGNSHPFDQRDREAVRERVRWFQAAVATHPESSAAHMGLGVALRDKGDLEGAIAELREVLRLDPGYPGIHEDLGHILGVLGERRGNKPLMEEGLTHLDPPPAGGQDRSGKRRGAHHTRACIMGHG